MIGDWIADMSNQLRNSSNNSAIDYNHNHRAQTVQLNSEIHNQNHSSRSNLDDNTDQSYENILQLQGSRMSQTAQIVLLPTQNISIANVPDRNEPVQMIVPNDMEYRIAFPNVSVLVPTTIFITDKNECILVTQNSQSINRPSLPSIETTSTESSSFAEDQYGEFQESGCEFITLANTATQTVIPGYQEDHLERNQTSNNCQIVGIIGTNQIGILQNQYNNDNQFLLAACVETSNGNDNLAQETESNRSEMSINQTESFIDDPNDLNDNYDVNAFLASNISMMNIEKSDPYKAKEWLKDSFILSRIHYALVDSNYYYYP
ncbi:Alpha-mannosidase [Sarcoptes scabiei]|nr:Alpha-mannosidase [Sarcoptes scabiei]